MAEQKLFDFEELEREQSEHIETLRKLVTQLQHNEENVPMEQLRTKYRKPYMALRRQIADMAQVVISDHFSNMMRIQMTETNEKLTKYLADHFDKQKRMQMSRQLSDALFADHDVDGFLDLLSGFLYNIIDECFSFWESVGNP